MLHPAAFDKGEHLKRFGRRAQVGDHFRVTGRSNYFPRRVDHDKASKMNRLYNITAGNFDQRLHISCIHCFASCFGGLS